MLKLVGECALLPRKSCVQYVLTRFCAIAHMDVMTHVALAARIGGCCHGVAVASPRGWPKIQSPHVRDACWHQPAAAATAYDPPGPQRSAMLLGILCTSHKPWRASEAATGACHCSQELELSAPRALTSINVGVYGCNFRSCGNTMNSAETQTHMHSALTSSRFEKCVHRALNRCFVCRTPMGTPRMQANENAKYQCPESDFPQCGKVESAQVLHIQTSRARARGLPTGLGEQHSRPEGVPTRLSTAPRQIPHLSGGSIEHPRCCGDVDLPC